MSNSLYEKTRAKLQELPEAKCISTTSRNALRDVCAILELLEHLPASRAYDIIDQARLMAMIRVHSDAYRKAPHDFDSTNAQLLSISKANQKLYAAIMEGCCNETT